MFILRWIIGFVVTVAAAGFAVINRHNTEIYWNPVGEDVLDVPVWLVALGFMALGFLLGGFVVWMNSGKVRSERRKQKKEIKKLEKEVGTLKDGHIAEKEASVAAGASSYPAVIAASSNTPTLTATIK